jgi:hypothetical protein
MHVKSRVIPDLLAAADSALYAAKTAGRNTVRLHPGMVTSLTPSPRGSPPARTSPPNPRAGFSHAGPRGAPCP